MLLNIAQTEKAAIQFKVPSEFILLKAIVTGFDTIMETSLIYFMKEVSWYKHKIKIQKVWVFSLIFNTSNFVFILNKKFNVYSLFKKTKNIFRIIKEFNEQSKFIYFLFWIYQIFIQMSIPRSSIFSSKWNYKLDNTKYRNINLNKRKQIIN